MTVKTQQRALLKMPRSKSEDENWQSAVNPIRKDWLTGWEEFGESR